MAHILGKTDGLFNPTLRFAFTNITGDVFTSAWGGSPIVVQPGETIELPHHLANKLTDELVDKIIQGEAKLDEVTYYKNNPGAAPNSYRSPKGMNLGVPAARRVFEDQIVRQMDVDEEAPEMQVFRAKIREELMADLSTETSREPVKVPTSLDDFAELGKETPKEEPKPLKIKRIRKPKALVDEAA